MSRPEVGKPRTLDAAAVESPQSERVRRKGLLLPKRPNDFIEQQPFKRQKLNFPSLTLDFLTPSPSPQPIASYRTNIADLGLPMKLPPPKPTLSPSMTAPFNSTSFPALNLTKPANVSSTAPSAKRRPPCVDLTTDEKKVKKVVKRLEPKNLTKPKPTKSVTKVPKRVAITKAPKRAKRTPIEFIEIPSTINYSLLEFKPKQFFGTWAGFGKDVFTIDEQLRVSGAVNTQIKKTKKGYTFKIFNDVWKVNEEDSTLETIEWENMNPKADLTQVSWTKIPDKDALAMNDLVGNWAGYGDDRFNVQKNSAGAFEVRHYELQKEINTNVKLTRRRGKTLLTVFGSCWILLNVVSGKNEVYWLRKDYKQGTGAKYACWKRLVLKKVEKKKEDAC